jgi:hypothetical protein
MTDEFKGTLLQEIIDIASSGNFCETEAEPVGDGEEIIGECTSLEKAVYTVFNAKATEIAKAKTSCKPRGKGSASYARIKMLEAQIKVLKKIFWQFIKDRLVKYDGNLGIRKGFNIVKFSDQVAERIIDDGLEMRILGPDFLSTLLGG